jgi:hypothetical protein
VLLIGFERKTSQSLEDPEGRSTKSHAKKCSEEKMASSEDDQPQIWLDMLPDEVFG